MIRPVPDASNQFYLDHINLLRQNYERLTGKTFGPSDLTGMALAQAIYEASYVVVSHGTEPDPIFNYANLAAQKLFELPWAEFCQLPSRQSAEVPNQIERQKLLDAVTSQGFMENYQGIRIAKGGRRFWIKNVTVWNLHDGDGIYRGQAAIYSSWEDIVEKI
ncbi:MEKHLA domain-containing protein [Synechocystis sp. LEGE 06083]|uniref:MEKHLA domain-containing protein n=1 Tax=Synechocystis sp. LEGE 06083 TaxID=915336 RepID=UPI0018814C23|nr:MEKHLA domain-containing protein [Synechocystis sp. LEGE 06083]MBE9196552.1 MEKHLA domain-containing protein [Synechocystis sp. LEGE 06083]